MMRNYRRITAAIYALLIFGGLLLSPDAAATPTVATDYSSLPECCRPRIAQTAKLFVINFKGQTGDEGTRAASQLYTQAADRFTSDPVLFLTFDMSTPPTAKQAEFLAKALGLDSVWNSFSKASGFIIIADGRTKKYRLKVTRFDTIDTIVAEVQKGLKETP